MSFSKPRKHAAMGSDVVKEVCRDEEWDGKGCVTVIRIRPQDLPQDKELGLVLAAPAHLVATVTPNNSFGVLHADKPRNDSVNRGNYCLALGQH